MKSRGLMGFQEVARVLGKSLGYTYQLHHGDDAFPPVEQQDGARKLFARHAVMYYKQNCRRWFRASKRDK